VHPSSAPKPHRYPGQPCQAIRRKTAEKGVAENNKPAVAEKRMALAAESDPFGRDAAGDNSEDEVAFDDDDSDDPVVEEIDVYSAGRARAQIALFQFPHWPGARPLGTASSGSGSSSSRNGGKGLVRRARGAAAAQVKPRSMKVCGDFPHFPLFFFFIFF
jgi:hypothetical protein